MNAHSRKATAIAHPNIAFVKYWGNTDDDLNLPTTPSVSMNLDSFHTITTVGFDAGLERDTLIINDAPASRPALQRVSRHLDQVRALAATRARARVVSRPNFAAGIGLASSASAFAALTLAAVTALGLDLSQETLSTLARLGSGSACRSIPPGFVEWVAGNRHETALARSIFPPDHWALCDCIAILDTSHKAVGSREGKARAPTSPLDKARVAGAADRAETCKAAIGDRDLQQLGEIAEAESVMMHAVTMTSRPPIYYWTPDTMRAIRAVVAWRAEGLPVYHTEDAGPNVHCICEEADSDEVVRRLEALQGVKKVQTARPCAGARAVPDHLF
jgi:diphosphomevalonate decarboxylase